MIMKFVSLNEIQSSLSPNEGIIQYYLTDKYLLAFLISENDIQLFQLEGRANLQEQILRYQKLISTPPSFSDFEAGLASFNELSNDLYNTLLKDINKSLNSTIFKYHHHTSSISKLHPI